jgi:carbonic anhydrase/acetyltransferase-like protein (isoleucine patch superfamily)
MRSPAEAALLDEREQSPDHPTAEGETEASVPMLLKSGSHRPSVDPSAVIAPNATLVGEVRIGARCVVGYGACLIAEGQPITLGEQVVVRDNAVIRSTAKYPVEIGNAVLIGPHAVLFGCTIEDEVFLATGTRVFHLAVVCKRAEVRVNAVVHLKTVVPEGATVPIGWIAVGDPALILSPDQHDAIWAVQKPLDFPATAYGLNRAPDGSVDMHELTRRLSESARVHRSEEA